MKYTKLGILLPSDKAEEVLIISGIAVANLVIMRGKLWMKSITLTPETDKAGA